MRLIKCMLTANDCYKAGRTITPKGVMVHSTGANNPLVARYVQPVEGQSNEAQLKAEIGGNRNANDWNNPGLDVCTHAFVGKLADGGVGTVQTLPWNHRGWHCGSGSKGSGNNTHIGVEMCEPACIKYTSGANFTCSDTATAKAVAKRTYEAAVELFAMLCRQYSMNPTADGVIISHREGHSRGIASNHGDPEHLWTQLGMGYTMDTFRQAVKAAMDGGSSAETTDTWYRVRKTWADAKSQKGAFKVLENAKNCADENPGYSVFDVNGVNIYTPNTAAFSPYLVRVSITDLNIRKGPGTNYAKTGKYTGIGTFTIVEEADGQGASRWGRLKSGAGWISLDYCTKI